MIEAQVYRFGPHSTSDDPKRYRTDEQLAAAKERDPILRLKAELVAGKQWNEESDQQLWEQVRARVTRTFEEAEKAPPLDPRSVFDDVFAEMTPRLAEERADFDAEVRDGVLKL